MEDFISSQPTVLIITILLLSLALVVFSADKLIDRAVLISVELGIPRIVVGATIISLGTTLPELATSIVAVAQGSTDLAVGNATGSVITNTTLVLGAGALFGSIPVLRETASKLRVFTIVMILLIGLCLLSNGMASFSVGGLLPQWAGILLLAVVPVYLFMMFKGSSRLKTPQSSNNRDDVATGNDGHSKRIRMIAANLCAIIIFAVLVAFGSDAVVSSASTLAAKAGLSEVLIASTIIALGTSLPELVTTVNAARKGHGDLAVGNVLGANILNMTLVLGYSATFNHGGVSIARDIFTTHFPVMVVIVAFFSYFVYNTKKHSISRVEGAGLIILYIAYLASLII
ncbi:MAG: calcium/sodium antiporter [Bifidobacterium sp.]|jgi:cation:H+ antiporter|nr:calcium/sodium antiporter [Bifidobacterium sp.]